MKKSSVVALVVASAVGFASVPAFARDHDGGRGHEQHYSHSEGRGYEHRGYEHRGYEHRGYAYAAPGYYAQPSYYQPYTYYQPAPYYYNGYSDSGDLVGAAILGALAGGLVGQMAR